MQKVAPLGKFAACMGRVFLHRRSKLIYRGKTFMEETWRSESLPRRLSDHQECRPRRNKGGRLISQRRNLWRKWFESWPRLILIVISCAIWQRRLELICHKVFIYDGYVPARQLPKKAVKRPPIKKPSIPPNSIIGRFMAVLRTVVFGTAFLGWYDIRYTHTCPVYGETITIRWCSAWGVWGVFVTWSVLPESF